VRYLALACDFDGTLAHRGVVEPAALDALARLRATGRRTILVTGRRLEDLEPIFPRLDLFDRVIVENGGVIYRPETRETRVLGAPPPEPFIQALRAHGVTPLEIGRVIVATREPQESVVLSAIRELGIERQVVFNKGAVMVLPSGTNKATGLGVALNELGLSPHNVVGIGDAENDHAFLASCECAAAVSNALPMVQDEVDLVTEKAYGAGVVELVERLMATDLAELEPQLVRHAIPLGETEGGGVVRVPPAGVTMLLAGTSGSGKSTIATGFLERLEERGYQFCVIDPEGDYAELGDAVTLGDRERVPSIDEVLEVLERPERSAVASLLGLSLDARPAFFDALLPRLMALRARTGRPHWIVIDESHHLVPPAWAPVNLAVPLELDGVLLITVHPEQIARAVLASVGVVIAVGNAPAETIGAMSEALGEEPPAVPGAPLEPGEAVAWWRMPRGAPEKFRSIPPRAERHRHVRKYAAGELGPDKSFYFVGPHGRLKLRAYNLTLFLQLAEGIDDETWMYHLRRGDYSRWLREAIKDAALADEAQAIEQACDVSPAESRARLRAAIEARYTAPA
jgi:hydroxymethylpyrimidine pyrophosphatase-like HAD family hydrolase